MPEPLPTNVLFVCLGNICRSPTAEGVFRAACAQLGLGDHVFVDSAGIGEWHIGSPPDRRAIQAARKRGYDLTGLRGRQVSSADFDRFGWILAVDLSVLHALEAMRPQTYGGHLGLLLDLVPTAGVREVPDPYYGGLDAFEHVLDLVEQASEELVARVRRQIDVLPPEK